MRNVQRYERFDGYMLIGEAVVDSDGFLRDSPIVARTGIYIYTNPDGTVRREYRPPDEVFNQDSLVSFMGKPITVDHPKVGRVNSKTARKLAIGTILSTGYMKDSTNVGCDVVIHTPEAIGNRRELSLGYRVDLEEVQGVTPDGEPYDAIQHNIRVNHLAVVQKARAGYKARLNMDGDECIESEEPIMSKIKIDSAEFEVDQAVASHIDSLSAKCDVAEAKAAAATTKLDTITAEVTALKADAADKQSKLDAMTAERDALKTKVDAAEADKKEAVEKAVENTKKEIKEKAELEDACKKAKVEKTDGMDNKAMKIAVIKAVRGDSFNADGKSDSYIDAAFDFAMEDLKADESSQNTNKQLNNFKKRQDGTQINCDAASEARAKMLQSFSQADNK